jgi:hypothetical protein
MNGASQRCCITAETLATKGFHMGIRTLKIGSVVTIQDSNRQSIITSIENGKYKLGSSKLLYDAGDLVVEKTKPQQKPRAQINQRSAQEIILNKIYNTIRPQYLAHNKTCIAAGPHCTHIATQIHHRYKRTGFWRIITNYFLPICRNCHKYYTKNSREAIDKGVSISRHTPLPYLFTDLERELMLKNSIKPPN